MVDGRAAQVERGERSHDDAPGGRTLLVVTRVGEGQRLLGHEQVGVFAFTRAPADRRAR